MPPRRRNKIGQLTSGEKRVVYMSQIIEALPAPLPEALLTPVKHMQEMVRHYNGHARAIQTLNEKIESQRAVLAEYNRMYPNGPRLNDRTKEETGRGIIKELKGFTDSTLHRHYYPSHEEWQIVEAGSVIKLDMVGQAEILLDRDECEDLSRLLRHFADHGTLPAPWKQEPSPVMEDSHPESAPTLEELQRALQIEADKIATQSKKEITPAMAELLIQFLGQLGITNLDQYKTSTTTKE